MIPIHDLLSHIRWDADFAGAQFEIGYQDVGATRAFDSACHGAGRAMSRHEALHRWRGLAVVDELTARSILIRSPSWRGVAEEAPLAYKDVGTVVESAEHAGLAKRVARLVPMVCVKG